MKPWSHDHGPRFISDILYIDLGDLQVSYLKNVVKSGQKIDKLNRVYETERGI